MKNLFFLIIFFFLSFPLSNDPDLGSHLKIGKYILEKKTILQKDTLSFSFPHHPYQYHSWGAEVLMSIIFEKFSFLGLSIFFGVILTLAIFILYKLATLKKQSLLSLFIFLPFISLFLRSVSVRPRAFSFLFYAFLAYIFGAFHQNKNSKLLFFLPFLFIFWANLHGGFLIGLLMVTLFLFFEAGENFFHLFRPQGGGPPPSVGRYPRGGSDRNFLKKLLTVSFLSLLACFLNPYGFLVFKTPFEIATNPVNISYNLEWVPLTKREIGNIALGIFYVFFLLSLLLSKIKFNKLLLFFSVIFFSASLLRNRNILPFLIFFLPLLIDAFLPFEKKLLNFFKKTKGAIKVTFYLYLIFFGMALLSRMAINTLQVLKVSFSPQVFANSAYYPFPYQAVLYLKNKNIGKRMFNNVNWGGYLLLNFPEKKVFANGLMDVYKVDKDRFFFEDYLEIVNLRPSWEELLEKYQIDSALLWRKDPLASALKLKKDSWRLLYEDEVALIFQKTKHEERSSF